MLIHLILVEVRGVEPLSWSTPKQISTYLVSTYCFSSLLRCWLTKPQNWLFLPVNLARYQRSLHQARMLYDTRIALASFRQRMWPSNYAANAYCSFAIIVLIDVLRGQRSSSTCNPPRTLPIESGTPPQFFLAFAQRQIFIPELWTTPE